MKRDTLLYVSSVGMGEGGNKNVRENEGLVGLEGEENIILIFAPYSIEFTAVVALWILEGMAWFAEKQDQATTVGAANVFEAEPCP